MKSNETFKNRLIGLQGNLLNFAYQLTANREQAEDLLQDTTLKALDNEEKYVDNVNFKGWIFTIMRNIFINNYRQTVRKATVIEYRIPFNMFVAGYKYNEIAEKMNLPLGTVKSRIFFARKRLREQLKDYGD